MTMLRVLAERAQCLVASPALLQAHGRPTGPADLERLPSIDLGQPQNEHRWVLNGPDGALAEIRHHPRVRILARAIARRAVAHRPSGPGLRGPGRSLNEAGPGLRRIICARRQPAQAQLPEPASVNSPVFASLIPVILCIGAGFLAARLGWVRAAAIKDLSNLVFLVLTPALLFRTMGAVRVQELDFQPVALYFLATALIFGVSMVLGGFSTRSAARGLANMFSNTVMIGVPLVGLVYGEDGLVTLFTLVSLHALILLTAATIVFELAEAREHQRSGQSAPRPMWLTVLQAVRNGIVHPVPLPILAGLLFAQTGLALPGVVDRSLQVLGQALGPMALLLVGVTLAYTKVGQNLREAVGIALVKNLVHPLLLLALAWAFGLGGLPVAVMFTAAALPVGANVFLFTQRYGVMQEEVSASIAVSTALALLTVPLMLWLAQRLLG